MTDVLLTIFWGIVLLSLIVVIHEGGHYLAARAFGVRVLEFMVGLPGPSIGFRRKGGTTRVGVTAVPFGGYARIAGMDEWRDESNYARAAAFLYKYGQIDSTDLEAASDLLGFDLDEALAGLAEWGTVVKVKVSAREAGMAGVYRYCAPEIGAPGIGAPGIGAPGIGAPDIGGFELGEARTISDPEAFIAHERAETYLSLPWWKRLVVCAAGPLANLLTAIVVVTLVLSLVGTQSATTTLSDVTDGGPAQQAGLMAGDTIVAVDGASVATWDEFKSALGEVVPGEEVVIGYTRAGDASAVHEATLVAGEDSSGSTIIGVVSATQRTLYAPLDAFAESISYIGQVTVAIVNLINPATMMETISGSTSIVGISVFAKQAAELGAVNFIWLAALLSVSIGLMNLLPLMPLDGGRIVVETIQRIRRKTLSAGALNAYTVVGMVFVFGLFFIVTAQDIGNLATGGLPF